MLKRLKQIIRKRFVARIICICALAASLMIILQGVVIGVYVIKRQERQTIDTSFQVLSEAEEYFANIYNKVKVYNTQLYKETLVREQVRSFVHKGTTATASDLIKFRRLLNEQLIKQFGNDYDALVEANYYDFASENLIQFYWTEAAQNREDYVDPTIDCAEKAVAQGAARQRIYELAVFSSEAKKSTLTLFDFVRDPDDLTNVTGVLMFHYSIEKITEKLHLMGFSDDMEVILVSQNGELCYDNLLDYERTSAALKEMSLSPGVYTQDGVRVVRYNSRFGFSAVSTIGKNALYGDIYRMSLFMVLCTITVLTLLILLLLGYERRNSRRMREIAESISKIEAGRLDVVLPETDNHDEVDILAHNLNEMQIRLTDQLEREKQNQERTRQLELMQKDAEFYALQAQIKPHFLFNTLEVIRMRAVMEHATDTAVMVRLLADIFRENVNRQTLTTVSEVINYCEKYVELFSYRFSGELIFNIRAEPSVKRYIIPTYVLQPILENALVHGLQADTSNPCLEISASMSGNTLNLCVCDNGCGMDEKALAQLREKIEGSVDAATSIGIANVNHRLQMLFGTEYGVTIQSRLGEGTKVTVCIPAITTLEEWGKYV